MHSLFCPHCIAVVILFIVPIMIFSYQWLRYHLRISKQKPILEKPQHNHETCEKCHN
jgi:hypothetical protein